MELFTQTAERPDLNEDALELKDDKGLIGRILMPALPVADMSGTAYVATLTSMTAQTNRQDDAAPDTVNVATAPRNYAVGEVIARSRVSTKEVKSFGGIENADCNGAAVSIDAVRAKEENMIARKVIASEAAEAASADAVVEAIIAAVDSIEGYLGRKVICGSKKAIENLLKNVLDSTYAPGFKTFVTGVSPMVAIEGLKLNVRCAALAAFFGVDLVLYGKNTLWTFPGTVAVGVFDGEEEPTAITEMRYKRGPVFGRLIVYIPDPVSRWPYRIQSIADYKTYNNLYDATAQIVPVTFNSGAVKTVGLYGVDSSDSASASGSDSASGSASASASASA